MNRLLIPLLSLTAIVFTSNPAIAQQVNPSQTVPTPNSISTSDTKEQKTILPSARFLVLNGPIPGKENSTPSSTVLDTSLTIRLSPNKQTCGMLEDNTRIGATGESEVVLGCSEF